MVFAPEHAREVRVALRVIVSEYGSEALSQPAMIARLLAAAAQDRVAETLHDHVSHGMDPATAARLAASSFAAATLFAPEVCAWVAGELVLALGLVTSTAAESLDEEIAPPEAFALAARPLDPPIVTLPGRPTSGSRPTARPTRLGAAGRSRPARARRRGRLAIFRGQSPVLPVHRCIRARSLRREGMSCDPPSRPQSRCETCARCSNSC